MLVVLVVLLVVLLVLLVVLLVLLLGAGQGCEAPPLRLLGTGAQHGPHTERRP